MTDTCATCRFFLPDENTPAPTPGGYCRRYPSTVHRVVVTQINLATQAREEKAFWQAAKPWHDATDWCGEHRSVWWHFW